MSRLRVLIGRRLCPTARGVYNGRHWWVLLSTYNFVWGKRYLWMPVNCIVSALCGLNLTLFYSHLSSTKNTQLLMTTISRTIQSNHPLANQYIQQHSPLIYFVHLYSPDPLYASINSHILTLCS